MSTPLYQEALIEAKKLREAATAEAKNAVLEAVSPLIKQMIDKEISGIILEQEEVMEPPVDLPPAPPPAPSPDAGTIGPVEPVPAVGGAEEEKQPMPGMAPAVSAAAPPIKTPGTDVIGKIDLGPAGEQQIVIPVDALFQQEAPPAAAATVETPTEPAPPPAPAGGDASMDMGATPPAPADEAVPEEEQPLSLAEIYVAVQRLLAEQSAPVPTPPAAPATEQPPATPPAAPADLNAAAGATAPAAPATPTPPAARATPPAPPPAAPPAPAEQPVPVTPAPVAAGVPAPAPVMEYKVFKERLEKAETLVQSLRSKKNPENVAFLKEAYEKQLFSLYSNLLGLKESNAISPRLFSFNEDRLGLLHENLNVITSYTQNPLVKGTNMASKNSLKDLVKALFEGAEGFEDSVGKVDPAGESEGGSADHARKASGNPKGIKAEAEAAPFATKGKNLGWDKASASSESLLEQLEEEIGELMAEMGSVEDMQDEDEVVLELADEDVMMEARKARARLRKLREQAEGDEGMADSLSLTIDLDGVTGDSVENVNVSLDGEELDIDMDDMEDMEAGEEDPGSAEGMEVGKEADELVPSEEEALMESRRIVRKAVNENKVLRGQLQETQLLTARSLYVNKLFVRDELTGAQKRKIVEYLDSARTIAEAKEVYNRLVRVLNTGKKAGAPLKESAARPAKVLTESVAGPSFDTSRWQILAGVKKNAK